MKLKNRRDEHQVQDETRITRESWILSLTSCAKTGPRTCLGKNSTLSHRCRMWGDALGNLESPDSFEPSGLPEVSQFSPLEASEPAPWKKCQGHFLIRPHIPLSESAPTPPLPTPDHWVGLILNISLVKVHLAWERGSGTTPEDSANGSWQKLGEYTWGWMLGSWI